MRSIMKVFKTYSLIIVIVLVGCTSKIEYQRVSGYALGTTYNITYFDNKVNPEVLPAIDSIFYVLNKSMSTYIKNSDISKINRGDDQVVVDHHFKTVFNNTNFFIEISTVTNQPHQHTHCMSAWDDTLRTTPY